MNRLVSVVGLLLASFVQAQDADAAVAEPPVPLQAPVAPAAAAPVPVAPIAPATIAPAPVAPAPVVASPAVRPSARDRRLGSFGFGFLGTASVLRSTPVTSLDPFTGRPTSIEQRTTVPMLGVRWWTPWQRLGLELGVGVMVSTSTSEQVVANGLDLTPGPETFEWVAHASAPLVLGSTEHIIFFVAPELRAARSSAMTSGGMETPSFAWTVDFGARAGVEIFFSFIGLDNLSIEAGVRLGLTHEYRSSTVSTPLQPERFNTTSTTRFATSLVANPWDLFTSTLAARYYF